MGNFDQQKRRTVYADGPGLDAFGRLRISDAYSLWQTALEYDKAPLYWDDVQSGAASANHLAGKAAVRMRVGGTAGDRAVRQSHRYIRYQPGKSQLVLLTGNLGPAQQGVAARLGYFDDSDGLYFESASDGLAVVLRSSVSGSIIEQRVKQANWNLDRMDGSGRSGSIGALTASLSNIYMFDMEWLGVGRVRAALNMDGATWPCHQFTNNNKNEGVYMRTANLPLRYELVNTATTGSAASMLQICSAVTSEGGTQEKYVTFSAANGSTLRTVSTTPIPVLSIRVASAFPTGQTNAASQINRMTVVPVEVDLFSEDSSMYWQIIRNPTLQTPNWTLVNASYSGVEYDISASSLTGGTVIESGYCSVGKTTAGVAVNEIQTTLLMSLNAAGTAGDVLTVQAVRVGTVNTDVGVAINWQELY